MRGTAALLAAAIAVAGCGSSTPTTPQPTVFTGPQTSDALPEPFGPQSSQSLLNEAAQVSDAPAPPDLRRLRGAVYPFSSVHHSGDHEDAGVSFTGTGRYTSFYAVHTLYPRFALSYPAGQMGTEWLFAPTSKAGCLENVTVYVSSGSGTQPQFSVYDWCNNGGYILTKNVDPTFVSKYVRTISPGETGYVTEIYAASLKPTAGTVWKSLIYNHVTLRWDTMTSLVERNPPTYNGWSIFETYYVPGHCSTTPIVAASHIEIYDTVLRKWVLLTPTLPGLSTSSFPGPPGDCFVADTTGPASYVFHLLVPDNSWNVN